ncbi:MAG TPA: peptidoglycan DD-metalloendopeptidase family protein [Bacillota bacterium]|nr:MAG: Murein hydrolase activator EnvC precursor [Firmicutes bacterium ADurb.Bin153]HNV34799.1 peptidoglycan DD-metalloendopeptidase family protein [Bacillota bacterium]
MTGMQKGKERSIAALLAALLLALCCASGGAFAAMQTDTEKTLEQLLKEIDQTKVTVNKYKAEEKNALKALQQVEDDLENTRYRITKAEKDLKYLHARLSAVEKELTEADRALEESQKDYEKTVKNLKQKLVAIYKAGSPKYMEMLFSSASFSEFVGKADYLRAMVEYDKDTLDVLKEEQAAIADKSETAERKKNELEATKAGISKLMAQLSSDEESLTAKYGAREKYLAQVQKEKVKWEKELAEEEKQSRELEALIRSKQSGRSSAASSKFLGRMLWPVSGRISSEFGWRIHPIFKDRRFHAGMDIAVPTGTQVKAAAAGKVLDARYISGYGYTVILDHGDGITTLYGHNSKLDVRAGRAVKQGDTISRAGSTGFSTGPHVHFEVREDGVAKEPRDYLVRK